MIKMNYAIAYLDKNGQGFSDTEPFIEYCFDSKDYAIVFMHNLKFYGYKEIKAFVINENDFKNNEPITWNYVLNHFIDLT